MSNALVKTLHNIIHKASSLAYEIQADDQNDFTSFEPVAAEIEDALDQLKEKIDE